MTQTHLRQIVFCFLIHLMFVTDAQAQTFTWSGNGADDNWSTGDNWSGGTPPVGGSTVDFLFDNTVPRHSPFQDISDPLNLRNFSVDSNSGTFNFFGQSLNFSNANNSIRWGGANLVNVHQDWIFSGNVNANRFNGQSGTLVHHGTISGNGALQNETSLVINGSYNATGQVTIVSALTVNGTVGNSSELIQVGTFGITQGGGLLQGTGVINRDVLSVPRGSGQSVIRSNGVLTINGDLTCRLDGASDFTRMTFGTIAVNGNTLVNGRLTVDSPAVISGTGNLTVREIGKLRVDGVVDSNKIIDLRHTGPTSGTPATLSGSGSINGQTLFTGGVVTGSLTFNDDVTVTRRSSTLSTHFGTLNEVIGGGFGDQFSRSSLTINGNVNTNSDPNSFAGIRLAGDFFGNGSINVFGATSQVTSFSGVDIANSLTVNLLSGSRMRTSVGEFGAVPSRFAGILNLDNAELNSIDTMFLGPINTTGNQLIRAENNNVSFDGVMTVQSGALTIGGIIKSDANTGSICIEQGASLQFENSAARMLLPTLCLNEATLLGTTGARVGSNVISNGGFFSGPLNLDGTLSIETPLTSTQLTGSVMNVAGLSSINDGRFLIDSGATLQGAGSLIVNAGTLDVRGTVRKDIFVNDLGVITGTGVMEGMIDIDGMLDPGSSAGTIGIDGSLTLGVTSVVCIEIGGRTTFEYDIVDGRGNSSLDLRGGILMLSLIDGFVPEADDEFEFFRNFASITGQFGSGPQRFDDQRIYFDAGSFAIHYGASSLRLSDFQPIPEPSSLMMIGGVVAVGLAVRRRRPREDQK